MLRLSHFASAIGSAALSVFGLGRAFAPTRIATAAQPRPVTRRRNVAKHPRNTDIQTAQAYLHRRKLHADRASSIAKLQRAFRIAGRSFDPEGSR